MTTFVISTLAAIGFIAYCVYKTKQAGEKIRRDLGEWIMSDDLEAPRHLMMESPEDEAVETARY